MNSDMPGKWIICPKCEGSGHNSHDFGAITADEWNGPDWDEESRESYLRGDYDKECRACEGSGKVQEVDVRRCTFAQKRELVNIRRSQRWNAEAIAEQQREAWMLGERD